MSTSLNPSNNLDFVAVDGPSEMNLTGPMSAADYIRALFASDDLICIMTRRQGEKPKHIFHTVKKATSTRFIDCLRKKNNAGLDIYVCMNPLTGEQRVKENVVCIRNLYIDIDKNGATALRRISENSLVPRPHFVLQSSPGKFQVIWAVKGIRPDEQERLLKALIREFGGDPAASDRTRVLRLPGFINHKYPEKPAVQVIENNFDGSEYTAEDFKVNIASTRQPAAPIPETIPLHERNNTLTSLAGTMRRRGASKDAILAALRETNKQCQSLLPDAELETIATSISKYAPAGGLEPKKSAEAASKDVEEYEAANATVLEYPLMGNDMLSQYARLLTQGTAIPFGHVRECLKNFLAFCLSDIIRYPGHEKLYLRGWHFNLGDAESSKTTALTCVMDRWHRVLTDLGIWIDKLSSFGSLQYLTKGFEDHERMLLYVTEGNTLANANEHIAAIFGGLSDLYDQPIISAGSYRNKSARCVQAKGSCIICFTPEDFLKAMQGKGVIGGGVLPRWTMSYSEKIHVEGDSPPPPDETALGIVEQKMLGRFNGVEVVETAEARAIRIALTAEMDRPEAGRHGKRLIEHYKRECLLAAVFANSGAGVITKDIAEWAATWTRYQLHLRITYWPIDAGNDVERMCTAMRGLLKRAHPKLVSLAKLKDAANVYREGSGGIEAFGRAYRAMMTNEEMRKGGQNAKGKDLFGLVCD